MKHLLRYFLRSLLLLCLLHGFLGVGTDEVSLEGLPVTLHTGVETKQEGNIKWYFYEDIIAQINRNESKICTEDTCKERFRDRLKLDHQTGSLIITDARTTDSGKYQLKFIRSDLEKTFIVAVHGSFADKDGVFVMEGDSVTLHTGVQTNQQEDMWWYFNVTRIAQINRDQSKVCTDVECKEIFGDRLKLDHQTGSLNITNITNTDSGRYKLKFSSGSDKIFSVFVHGVSAAERDEVKRKSVKEGESVTLYTGVTKQPNYLVKWYFNDVLMAEISGDQSQICTDDQCEERFRDRLKLDHQTGSLTITHTTNTDSGEYYRMINNSGICIIRSFSVFVNGSGPSSSFPRSGPSSAAKVGICAAVLLVAAVVTAAVIYCHHKKKRNGNEEEHSNHEENGGPRVVFSTTESPQGVVTNGIRIPTTETERPLMADNNEIPQ